MLNSSTMLTTSKRILIFSLAYFPHVGGAEIAIKELTDRMPDFEFDMLTLSMSQSDKRIERVGNVNVYRLGGGLGYMSKILFIPRAAFRAWRLSREKSYTALWAMMTYMLFPIVLMRLFGNRTPYILALQDGDPFTHVFRRWFIWPFRPLLNYGFRHATRVQAISNYLAEWARKVGSRGIIEVIPNGVDLQKFSISNLEFSKNTDKITLITVSRLVKKNAVEDIIESLKFLPENITLQILGSGPLESELRLQARSLKLESRVQFLGEIPNSLIPQYLHVANIFVRPSLSEGQGISFIEAMAVGLPVIATPVGGTPDFIKEGETGLFCRVGDPESIADAVERLIQDESLKIRIIEESQRLVREKYDWNLITNAMKSRVFDI